MHLKSTNYFRGVDKMFSDRVYNINGWMVRLVFGFSCFGKEELLFSLVYRGGGLLG